jgi:imidazolonepropionase-like amidohydrolase
MPAAGTLAVVNARLWDGTGRPPVDGATVVIEDGRVTAAGAGVAAPDGIAQLDAGGRFVMPGLVDMHVHVLLSGGEGSLPAFLGAGITSVRDVGGAPDVLLPLRDAIAAGDRVGPRLFTYGPLLDGDPPIFPPGGISVIVHPEPLRTPKDGVAAVRALIARGVDGLKLYAGLRPDLVEAMIRAVDGAVPVTGHLGRTWASEAIAAGIDCLEHVHATCYQDIARPEDRHTREGGNGGMPNYWTWLNEGWARADLDADHVRRFVASLVEHDVALSPTTVLITNGISTTEANAEPGLPYTPRPMVEAREERQRRMQAMREEAERAGRPVPGLQRDPAMGQRARDQELAFLRRAHEAGVKLVPSTDCGSHTGLVPGFSLLAELELLAAGGIANGDVLQGATRVAAEVLRRERDLGTLEPGKWGDLLVLDGDPLRTMSDVRRTRHVVQGGVAHDPAALLATIPT